MIVYIETSAAAKILFQEAETESLKQRLDELVNDGNVIVSAPILETELRRAAVREQAPQATVTAILNRFDIIDLDRADFHHAGILPGAGLRSLDALHVVAALRANADAMISYDRRQIEAAEGVGLSTLSPA